MRVRWLVATTAYSFTRDDNRVCLSTDSCYSPRQKSDNGKTDSPPTFYITINLQFLLLTKATMPMQSEINSRDPAEERKVLLPRYGSCRIVTQICHMKCSGVRLPIIIDEPYESSNL